MTEQLTDIIYNAVDAAEENNVMKSAGISNEQEESDPELEEKEDDTAAQKAEKTLKERA